MDNFRFILSDEEKQALVEYQQFTNTTAIYPKEHAKSYPILGLIGEIGEFIYNLVIFNDQLEKDVDLTATLEDLKKELGDIFWYLARITVEYGMDIVSLFSFSEQIKKTDQTKYQLVPYHVVPEMLFISVQTAEKAKKCLRGDANYTNLVKSLEGELLDQLARVLLYLIDVLHFDFTDVINSNKEKLSSRKERGVLAGSGDNR